MPKLRYLLLDKRELTRGQLDAEFSRDSFWGVIEGRYNDPGLKIYLNMVGNVDDIDSTVTTPVHRSASFLKVGFSSVLARGVFCTFPLFPPFLFPLFHCSSNSNSIG